MDRILHFFAQCHPTDGWRLDVALNVMANTSNALPPMSVGIDSYSYHRFFGETTAWEQPVATRWQTEDFLRRAASLRVDRVSLQTVYLPPLSDANMVPAQDH